MRCLLQVSPKAHPYALVYHFAAHAVVMDRLDIPVISIRVNPPRRTGGLHALMQHRGAEGSRMLVERDVVAAYAGCRGQERGCGRASWFGAEDDGAAAWKRLMRFTRDTGEQTAWGIYLRERARVLVRECWHEITVIAAVLQRERAMDGASLGATLEAFRRNPFRSDLRPLRPIPWEYPTSPKGQDEVELLWSKPKLSEIVARARR